MAVWKWMRILHCWMSGHTLVKKYRPHTDKAPARVWQACLTCPYQSHGWTVDSHRAAVRVVRKLEKV